jgi:prevent-host-death family protein
MKTMKQTNVSGLKAHLSEYLAAVRSGETVVVHDRRTPIARLVPVGENAEELSITEPSRPTVGPAKIKPPRLRRRVDVVRLLRESRDQR